MIRENPAQFAILPTTNPTPTAVKFNLGLRSGQSKKMEEKNVDFSGYV